jgi:hypothetical protein
MLARMAKHCFCGCGREVPLGRRRAANILGATFQRDLELFEGALARDPELAGDPELADLVPTGRRLRDDLRDVIHGTKDRKEIDKPAQSAWIDASRRQRVRLAKPMASAGVFGWDSTDQARLFHTGARAPAYIVSLEETGTEINDNPRVRIRLRVEPPGEPPFEVERKVLVSRIAIPRQGERVELAYDPADHSRFAFKRADLTDDQALPAAAAPDIATQLEKLAGLRQAGVLNDEEFEAAKERLLGGG